MTISSNVSSPLIVVLGATGAQGGSVIRALSESSKSYRIRGITRDLTTPAAKALTDQGVEMVVATVSATDLENAFQGASYIFAVTIFWAHGTRSGEFGDGKIIVDAAKTVPGLKLFVWSGLEDMTAASNGKYTLVEHFDGKAQVTQYAKDQGLPLANVQAAMYMANFLTFFAPLKQEDGSYVIVGTADPSTTVLVIDASPDYGKFVRAAIENPELGPGSELIAFSEDISWETLAKQLSEGTGKRVFYKQYAKEKYLTYLPLPESRMKEIYEMFQGLAEFGHFGGRDIQPSRDAVKDRLTTWSEFAKTADWSKSIN